MPRSLAPLGLAIDPTRPSTAASAASVPAAKADAISDTAPSWAPRYSGAGKAS